MGNLNTSLNSKHYHKLTPSDLRDILSLTEKDLFENLEDISDLYERLFEKGILSSNDFKFFLILLTIF